MATVLSRPRRLQREVLTAAGPRHWPGFPPPVTDREPTVEHIELLDVLARAQRNAEYTTMSLLMFDDATSIVVTLVPTEGPHPVWDDSTAAWLLPMLGPTPTLLIPHLYKRAANPYDDHSVDDLAFALGVGRGQFARALDRLSRFHVVDDVDVIGTTITVSLRSHIRRATDRAMATWPDWYRTAYQHTFPESPAVPA